MTLSARSLLSLPLFALGAACAHADLNSVMNARVLTLPPGAARDAAGLRPAEGAKVALNCPGGDRKELGTTDSLGELHAEQSGALPLACSLVVAQPGYQSFTTRVSEVCAEAAPGGCQRADLRAVLASSRTGSAGGVR